MTEQFLELCKNGDLDGIKALLNNSNVNIHTDNEGGFRWACCYGHKHIVEYLVNLYKINPDYTMIDIHANNEQGFKCACKNEHKDIVEYLINLGSYYNTFIIIP